MRIAYLCYWNLDIDDGVARKVRTQSRLWREAGHEVELAAIAPGEPRERLRKTVAASSALARFRPDIVYVRYDLFLPPAWMALLRHTAVLEVNSDDRAEWRLRSRGGTAYNQLNRRLLFGAADGVVAVAHELVPAGKRSVVVGNGVDPDLVPVLPAPVNERPRAVFIGSPRQPWQGFDKVLALARAVPEVDIDLIGPGHDELLDVPPNVVVHGRLSPEQYRPLLGRADVALGTLALHRKGMTEASPLKVREYLLAGIPTVIAYDDTDLRGLESPWLLRLPNDERNVDASVRAIGDFAARMRGVRVPRDLAEARLGALAKEARRLEFLESIAHRTARP